MEKHGIVILGNGFDLFHKNKTSYKDFIQEVKMENTDNIWINYFDSQIEVNGWIDIENEFNNIINSFSNFSTLNYNFNIDSAIDISYSNLFSCLGFAYETYSELYNEDYISNGQRKIQKKTKFYYDKIILKRMKYEFVSNNILLYSTITSKLINDFYILKRLLKDYISTTVTINEHYTNSNSIFENLNKYEKLIVLNFNYTNTLSFYNENIINIPVHGSVNDEIIFGHNDILDLEFSMFNKHVQTQISDMNYKYIFENALYENALNAFIAFDLIVLGHSFDSNDHGIFKWLYESVYSKHNYFNSLRYFYYPSSDNWDLISRNHNIRIFYSESLDYIINTDTSHIRILKDRILTRADKHYKGIDEFDYFQRINSFEKIELK